VPPVEEVPDRLTGTAHIVDADGAPGGVGGVEPNRRNARPVKIAGLVDRLFKRRDENAPDALLGEQPEIARLALGVFVRTAHHHRAIILG
jgi:hypothetical protein